MKPKQKAKNKSDQILDQVATYCREHLDQQYADTCSKVFRNLIEEDPAVFDRGKEEIWAASVVWAIGSINFLGDKSFEPYASLEDVCSYFSANKSSVGQKSAKIRKLLNITRLNPDYHTTSQVSDFLNSLVMTPGGFIISTAMFEDQPEEEDMEEPEIEDPAKYIVKLMSSKSINSASIYQLEHLVKSILPDETHLKKIEIQASRTVLISIFGTLADIEAITEKLSSSNFRVIDAFLEYPEDKD